MIVATRAEYARILEPLGWEIYDYEPPNINNPPSIVVGRCTINFRANHLALLRTTIWLIGRRLGDQESSVELDVGADKAFGILRAAGVLDSMTPTISTIADLNYPSYRIDCLTGDDIC